MNILFGHPTGNPNSHHAALAHFRSGRLAGFCVPWMPSGTSARLLRKLPVLSAMGNRLARRHFAPLVQAPLIQGRLGEFRRLLVRAAGHGDEGLAYEANDWLMETMCRECRRSQVSAVHAYEDCSLLQFEEARRLGKACIYDMPIGYYPAWVRKEAELAAEYADWLPPGGRLTNHFARPEQKRKEMALADLVLAPSSFVKQTIDEYTDGRKNIRLAPYGVDLEAWHDDASVGHRGPLRFMYAGQCSLRKGLPVLLQAWKLAALTDATLELVGAWRFSDQKRRELPRNVVAVGAVPAQELRRRLQGADVFVFPSFFEGLPLVILEALACGLPVIASNATAATDLVTPECGEIFEVGKVEPLVELLRRCAAQTDKMRSMRAAARKTAEAHGWSNYRACVDAAVSEFLSS